MAGCSISSGSQLFLFLQFNTTAMLSLFLLVKKIHQQPLTSRFSQHSLLGQFAPTPNTSDGNDIPVNPIQVGTNVSASWEITLVFGKFVTS